VTATHLVVVCCHSIILILILILIIIIIIDVNGCIVVCIAASGTGVPISSDLRIAVVFDPVCGTACSDVRVSIAYCFVAIVIVCLG
jgi:hypothetical protein